MQTLTTKWLWVNVISIYRFIHRLGVSVDNSVHLVMPFGCILYLMPYGDMVIN